MISSKLTPALVAAGIAFAFSRGASAQTPYQITHTTGTWTPITGGTTHTPQKINPSNPFDEWDEGYAPIPLPFDFTFFSGTYDTLYLHMNGLVSFSPFPQNGPSIVGPAATVPNPNDLIHNFIAVAWDDLIGDTTGEIRSETLGTAPNRIFVVQATGFRAWDNQAQSTLAYQIRLHEGSAQFEVVYGPNAGLSGSTAAIENENGTEGYNLMANTATGCGAGCTCLPTSCGSPNWQPTGKTISVQLPNAPELTASISAPPGAYPGTNFPVNIALRNLGLQPTGAAYSYELFLTTTNTTVMGGTSLGTFTQAAQAASSVVNVVRNVTMPAGTPVGTYYVAVVVDTTNAVAEVIETNNTAFSGPINTAPDLTGTISAPSTTGPGEMMMVDFTIQNRGAPVTSPVAVTFFMSTDTTLDQADTNVHTQMFTLTGGFDFSGNITLTVPATIQPSPPTYYLIADIDSSDQVTESNENNNAVVSAGTIDVDGPDLAVETFDGPPIAFRGQPYPISMEITNDGGASARNFTACVLISRNLLVSLVSDTWLIETGMITLGPGESQTLMLQPMIPTDTSSGTWYVAGVADCQTVVNEAVETNNVGRRNQPILIRDVAPDFIPLEVSTTSAAAAGEQLPVAVRFANLGNDTGAATMRLVISDNPGITDADRTIYDSTTPVQLAPPAETTSSVWASIPGDISSGNYYIGAIIDPTNQVDEIYEDNNTVAFGPIVVVGADLAIVSPAPPPAIIGVAYTRRFSAVGGTAPHVWELTWGASAPEGITFDASIGELRGMPPAGAEGSYPFTVRVTSGNLSAERSYNLIVTPPTVGLEVVSSQLPPALAREPYSVELVAVGGTPPYRWSFDGGDVPPGISLSELGVLGGEPQIVGGYTFTVQVRDVTGASASGLLALDVVDPASSITITTADVPDGEVGAMYMTSFAAAGGSSPYTWRLEGSIPGLEFDGTTAILTGTPTIAGDYGIVVEVRDSRGLIDRNAYVLTILEEGALQITNGQSSETGLPNGKVGVEYLDPNGEEVRLRAVKPGGEIGELVWTILEGTLPPGLTLDAKSGVIAGVPSQAGAYPFIVQVRDSKNDVARTSLVIFIEQDEMRMPGPDDRGCGCSAAEEKGTLTSLALFGAFALFLLLRKRAWLFALLVVALPSIARAQPVPYQIFETVEPYTQLPPGATPTPPLGDGTTVQIDLPFEFYFYGVAYDRIYVNANGLIGVTNLGSGNHYPQTSVPTGTPPNGWITGLWADWCADANSSFCGLPSPGIGVFYSIDDTPGIGSITIEYRNLTHYSDEFASSRANFQITLHEGLSSMIEIHFGPMEIGTDFFGLPTEIDGRIGIENPQGNEGMWLGPCQTVVCNGPTVLSLPNQKITLIADAGEDVAVAGVQVPPVGYPGLPFSSSVRLISRHQNPLGPFRYAVYLIPATGTSTAGGRMVYESDPLTLSPYESRVVTYDVEVPNDQIPGQYRVGVLVDSRGQLDETSEANNFAFSGQSVRIADRAPDFRVVAVRPLQHEVRPGQTLDVAYTVENFGNEPGSLELQAYLSTNEAITISDVPFGSPITIDTMPRETVSGTISAEVPAGIATGAYFAGVILDPRLAVPELDEANNVGRSAERTIVSSTEVAILTEELPPATLGQGYSTRVRAAGGRGTFEFTIANGTLPQGVSFTAGGELTGIPLEVGAFPLEIRVTSGAVSDTAMLNLQVLDPSYPLTIVSRTLPDGTLGSDYVVSLVAVGGAQPYGWRLADGSLPAGLVLAPNGTIFGAPSQAGFTTFTVEVRDNMSATASVSLNIDVRSPGNLTIVSSDLADAYLDEPYTQQLVAVGGVPPITWRAVDSEEGMLPPGLTVSADGVLTGIPEKAQTYRFRVEATDARGTADTNELTLTVLSTGRFAIVTTELPVGQPGQEFRAVIRAEGGDRPYTWEVVRGEGFLPPGFVVEQSNGIAEGETENDLVVRGLLEREGQWAFTARVYDAKLRFDERPFAIVSRIPEMMTDNVDEGGCGCTSTERRGSALWALVLLPLLSILRRRRASKIAIATLFLLAANPAMAQVYVTAQYGAAYVPLSGSTPLSMNSSDDGEAYVVLPFPFTYYGVTYEGINVGVNGAAVFANACTTSSQCGSGSGTCTAGTCRYDVPYLSDPIPSSFQPNQMLAVFWDDLRMGVAPQPVSQISTQTLGTAPNRVFVIEWSNIGHYNGDPTMSRANFQIHLDEASGAVRYHYGPFSSAFDDSIWDTAVIGIENHDGTVGVLAPLPCAEDVVCGAADLQALTNQVIEFVVPTAPELVGSASSATGGEPGTPFSVTIHVQNIGTQPAPAFEVAVYFSTDDNQIETTDMLLGTANFTGLAAGASAMGTVNANVPNVPTGRYTVGAIIDSNDTVPETVETNNTVVATTTFLVGADLGVAVAAHPPTGPNESDSVEVRILNYGAAQPAVGIAVYLSNDAMLDPAVDYLIGTATVAVPAQPTTVIMVPTTIPSDIVPGTYYTFARVDFTDAIVEADENNNDAVSLTETIVEGPDIEVSNVAVDGTFIFLGGQIRVSGTIRNVGGGTSPPFYYAFHLSENELINALSDSLIGEYGPITLAPGQSIDVQHTADVPAGVAPGPYYVGLIGDSQSNVIEQFEANNIARTNRRHDARDPAPDFMMSEILLPSTGAAGESFVVSRTILNAGNASATVSYDIYLSADATIDPSSDTRIGGGTVTIDGFSEAIGVDSVRIPSTVAIGNYYVGYHLDPNNEVAELIEENNLAQSSSTINVLPSDLAILTQELPVAVLNTQYEVLFGAAGGSGRYIWSLAGGTLPEGLSLDAMGLLSGSAREEGFFDITVAVSDGSITAEKAFVLIVSVKALPLEIVTRSLLPAFVGKAYRYPVTAFGGIPPYTWSVDGNLPDGISMSESGVLSGAPTAPAAETLTFRVTDATGASAERPIAIRVVSPDDTVRMADDVLPDGNLNEAYDVTLRVAPGTGASPFHFGIAGGELPRGLILELDRIYGVPTKTGIYTFAIRVNDGRGDFDVNRYVVEIGEGNGLSFVTTDLPRAKFGQPYLAPGGEPVKLRAVAAEATAGEITYRLVGGELVPGLTLAPDGLISGTPSAEGAWSFIVLAQDELGQIQVRAFGILVEGEDVVLPVVEDEGCGCTAAHTRGSPVWFVLAFGLFFLLRGRLRLLLIASCLALPGIASAQSGGAYITETFTETYQERTGGTVIPFFSNDDDDAILTLPFEFTFFGTSYTEVTVGTNGLVTFGTDAFSRFNEPVPSPSTPNNLIAPFWDDVITYRATTIVEGTAPNRAFIIQWEDAIRFIDSAGGNIKMQVILYEGLGGRFEVRYGPIPGMTNPTIWSATAGFEDAAGAVGYPILPCNGGCTGTDFANATNTVFRAFQDGGPDIVARWIEAPGVVYPGIPFPVPITIQSVHMNPLGPFVYRIHLLPPGQSTPNNPIFTSQPTTLSAYQVLSVAPMVTVPIDTAVGRYRLALEVDANGQLTEPNELNNQIITQTDFRLAERQPDFRVSGIVPETTDAVPGATVMTQIGLSNAGNFDGSTSYTVVLSRNRVISTDDVEVYTSSIDLPLLTTTTVSVPVALPPDLAPGEYFIGAVMDPMNAVAELDEINNAGAAQVPLNVTADTLVVDTSYLPGAYVEVPYSVFLRAAGGDGSYAWSLQSGNLPQGLNLLSSGEIRGTPTSRGTAIFTVEVTSGNLTAEKELMIDVEELEGGLAIVTRELLPGIVGDAYPPANPGTPIDQQQRIVAVGATSEVRFSLKSVPPPGLELEMNGYLHGVPLQAGDYELVVEATDGRETTERTLILTVGEPGRLTVIAAVLPDAQLEDDYSYQIRVLGTATTSTVTFDTGGPLPDGLTLTTSGAIVGVPQKVGTWMFSVRATQGLSQDTATFWLSVVQDVGFGISPSTLPDGVVGEQYVATIEAREGEPPFTWRLLGQPLPPGLMYEVTNEDRQKVEIKGIPTEEAFVSFLVTLTDGEGRTAQQPMSIRIEAKKQAPPPPMMDEGCGCHVASHKRDGGPPWLLLALAIGQGILRRRRCARR